MAYLDNFNALNADGSDASPPPPPVVDSTLTVQDAFGNELTEDSVSVLSAGGAVTLAQPSVTTPGAGVSATVGQGSGDNPIRDWLDFLEPSENWGKWRDVARSGEMWRDVARSGEELRTKESRGGFSFDDSTCPEANQPFPTHLLTRLTVRWCV